MSKIINNILYVVLVFLLIFSSLLIIGDNVGIAKAESISFDDTKVLDDLNSSKINGQDFNINDYPVDENGSIKIITFVEYCYSDIKNQQNNYGLYLYIYNPQRLNIISSSKQNMVTMAVHYKDDGTPDSYDKFRLECLSVSDNEYSHLFYKFKIKDHFVNNTMFLDRVNSNSRRYDISEIELIHGGNHNATSYGVGGTYVFTGFAEGFGSVEQPLNCLVKDLETCQLEVHSTYFRTNVSSLGVNHYNQLNTVYFAIDKRYIEEYGYIQKIRAMWYEFMTQMALVTSNYSLYLTANQYNGYKLADNGNLLRKDLNVPVRYVGGSHTDYITQTNYYDWEYNCGSSTRALSHSDILPIVLYSERATANSQGRVFDFLNKIIMRQTNAGPVDGTTLLNYMYNYNNSLGHGYIDDIHELSADLFTSSIDSSRISQGINRGFNDITIDLNEDRINMLSYDSNHSSWQKFWDYGFYSPQTNGDYIDKDPIYFLSDSDFEVPEEILNNSIENQAIMTVYGYSNSDAYISENLMVNPFDVSTLRDFYNDAKLNDKTVVLFRYAVTDYYSLEIDYYYNNSVSSENNHDTYVCQETVFLDFDIIELTFNKDGFYTVIPAVSSPVDIVAGFDPPADRGLGGLDSIELQTFWNKVIDFWNKSKNIFKYIGIAVLSLIVLIILIKIISAIVKAVSKKKTKDNKTIKKKFNYQLKSNKDLKKVKKNE